MSHRTMSVTAIAALLAACASRAAVAPAPSMASTARCRAINDSVAASSDLAALPEGGFRDGAAYRSPRLPAGTPKGTRVLVRYVSSPEGAPELGLVEIGGTDDAAFREQAIASIRGVRLLPGRVAGCPVRSRVDVYITKS